MNRHEVMRALRAKGFTTKTWSRGQGVTSIAFRVRGTVTDMVGFGQNNLIFFQNMNRHQYLAPGGLIYSIPEENTKHRRVPWRAGYFTMNDFLASL